MCPGALCPRWAASHLTFGERNMEETNPEAKAAILEVIENQLSDNDPPETAETLNRLVSEGITQEDAMLYLGQAVCVEIWDIMTNGQEFDLERYKREMKMYRDKNEKAKEKEAAEAGLDDSHEAKQPNPEG